MSSKISDDFFSHQPLFQNLLLCIFISLSLFLLFMYFSKNSSLDHGGAKNGFCIPHLNYWGARARPAPPRVCAYVCNSICSTCSFWISSAPIVPFACISLCFVLRAAFNFRDSMHASPTVAKTSCYSKKSSACLYPNQDLFLVNKLF